MLATRVSSATRTVARRVFLVPINDATDPSFTLSDCQPSVDQLTLGPPRHPTHARGCGPSLLALTCTEPRAERVRVPPMPTTTPFTVLLQGPFIGSRDLLIWCPAPTNEPGWSLASSSHRKCRQMWSECCWIRMGGWVRVGASAPTRGVRAYGLRRAANGALRTSSAGFYPPMSIMRRQAVRSGA